MVATLLSELAGKGLGKYALSSSNDKDIEANHPISPLPKVSASSSTSSLQKAAQSAYSGISNVYSSLYMPSLGLPGRNNNENKNEGTTTKESPKHSISEEDVFCDSSASISGLSKSSVNSKRRRKSMLSPNLLTLMNNPYIGVRGGGRLHSAKPPNESMDAVRKLLYVVDDDKSQKVGGISSSRRSSQAFHDEHQKAHRSVTIPFPSMTPSRPVTEPQRVLPDNPLATPRHRNSAIENNNDETVTKSFLPHQLHTIESMSRQSSTTFEVEDNIVTEREASRTQSVTIGSHPNGKTSTSNHSPEETASQLTEGTLRAMRDLALDEALELHGSLKYWSDRWERPIFSWFVAGPLVWFGFIESTIHHKLVKVNDEAGFGRGYDHSEMVGRRVSQIQAVLARRLSAIGELQHHLLRAGWQRGVADWGFLGEGGNWAAVDGTDGRMGDDDDDTSQNSTDDESYHEDDELENLHDSFLGEQQHEDPVQLFAESSQDFNATQAVDNANRSSIQPLDLQGHRNANRNNPRYRLLRRDFSENEFGMSLDLSSPPIPQALSSTGKVSSKMYEERRKQPTSLYYANLNVRKRGGGHIQKDEQALAEWSIDALALIRSQLIRAANGKLPLPFSENWPFEHVTGGNASVVAEESVAQISHQNGMPAWAGIKYVGGNNSNFAKTRSRMESRGSCFSITEHADSADAARSANDSHFPKVGMELMESHSGEEDSNGHQPQFSTKKRSPSSQRSIASTKERAIVGISNLPLMMNEVSGILDVMEDIMDIQRARRLEKLKPPPWWRRNWFLIVLGPPTLGYFLYNNLLGKGQTWNLVKFAAQKMMDFAREHVVLPCVALYDELTKGNESICDHAARDTATATLKKMIYSWLDETYPEMKEAEKLRLSDAMDITLVEEAKEISMTSVYNLNSVIRMSFIEAQFIKKEMMNALVALDEMQASTNFNMNLAAITPFVLLMWSIKRVSTFIFYTMFKWGKSRSETYRSFLDGLTEIERLLIMRSNSPIQSTNSRQRTTTPAFGNFVLESDDLGMLMLHIHELRTILWQERRRFSPHALRSVSEDLAELSGERGAVSVRQQLLIVERMNRAYSFLKQGAID